VLLVSMVFLPLYMLKKQMEAAFEAKKVRD
jgi:hypothetical protein